jgi:hypothetical protein
MTGVEHQPSAMLESWVTSNAESLAANRVRSAISLSPDDWHPRSAHLTLEGPARLARLSVWEGHQADLTFGDAQTQDVVVEHHGVALPAEVDAIASRALRWVVGET